MSPSYDLAAFDYELPPESIAQQPAPEREDSRLMVLDAGAGRVEDLRFRDILRFFRPGDLLVVNDTRVFPARLQGRKETGGRAELLLLEYPVASEGEDGCRPGRVDGWRTARAVGLIRSSKRPRAGTAVSFGSDLEGRVTEVLGDGKVRLELRYRGELDRILDLLGRVPLPPYISRKEDLPQDRERYQTRFATELGAVAAPTAGLHFSDAMIGSILARGVRIAPITLHVGYGTFAPVREKDIRRHRIHEELVIVSPETAAAANATREAGGSLWAVGTTTARALEWAADEQGRVRPACGQCGLFIYPGYRFRVVRNLITNFHLPRSSLLFLVSALAGRTRILQAYGAAVRSGYRFFSYGDAMLIVNADPREHASIIEGP